SRDDDGQRDTREREHPARRTHVPALTQLGGAQHELALDVGQPFVVERLDGYSPDELHAPSFAVMPGSRNSLRIGSAAAASCTFLRARHTRSFVAVTDEPTSSATSWIGRPSISWSVNARRAAGGSSSSTA